MPHDGISAKQLTVGHTTKYIYAATYWDWLSACSSSGGGCLSVFGVALQDDVDGLGDRLRTMLGSSAPAAFFIRFISRPAELVAVLEFVLEMGGD